MSDTKQPAGLEAYSKGRSQALSAKLDNAMKSIELEIEKNDGIYPLNGGRLSQAELCRRAGIGKAVLQGESHKKTTLVKVNKWLDGIRKRQISGSKVVRKTVTDRADDWKQRYELAANHSNLYHLQMVTLQNRLERANARITELEAENLKLYSDLSHGKVVRMPKPKKPG